MLTKDLSSYLADLLSIDDFKDYGPNGLQVQGRTKVNKIITGVTACKEIILRAIAEKADAILVHHGFFWQNEEVTVLFNKKENLKLLLENEINLFGYHLPLDAHTSLGNNVGLGHALGLQATESLMEINKHAMGFIDELPEPISAEELSHRITNALDRKPLHVATNREIKRIAWCTGGAQGRLLDAYKKGADAYISGEINLATYHLAKDLGIHYFAAGHHATERFGPKALGEHLQREFSLEHEFVDMDVPV